MNLSLGEAYRWGSALDWALLLTIVMCVLILVGIIASRVMYPNPQTEGSALWFHLPALGIFPLFLLLFGNFTVM